MAGQRTIGSDEDPVCGMTVNLVEARGKGLTTEHGGREYGFCGKGCFLEFGDDPDQFLAEDYVPQM
jgi:YHS domain-containing protein